MHWESLHGVNLIEWIMHGETWVTIPFGESVRGGKMGHRPMIFATSFSINWVRTQMLKATVGSLTLAHLISHAELLETTIPLNLREPLDLALGFPGILLAL